MSANNTFLFVVAMAVSMVACKKPYIDPALEGAWIEVNPVTKQTFSGACEFAIGSSDVAYCGYSPIMNISKTKLWADGGQVWYRQKIGIITTEEYLYDYKADGAYMWIKEENTDAKTNASLNGKLFKRQ